MKIIERIEQAISTPARRPEESLGSPFSFPAVVAPPANFSQRLAELRLRLQFRFESLRRRDTDSYVVWLAETAVRFFREDSAKPDDGPSRRFLLCSKEAARVLEKPVAAWAAARFARDIFFFLGTLWLDIGEFEAGADRSLRKMTDALLQAVTEFSGSLGRVPTAGSRLHLEGVRRHLGLIRILHREALETLMKDPNSIDMLKRRELYRHLARAGESLEEALLLIHG